MFAVLLCVHLYVCFEARLIHGDVSKWEQNRKRISVMEDNRSQSDKQQQQPKKPRKTNWAQKMRDPETLRLLFQSGPIIYKVGKWLIELLEL